MIEIIIFAYFIFLTFYILIYSLAGLFRKKIKYKEQEKVSRFAVLMPGYKEDNVIIDVAKKALKQSYPSDKYDVIVIADSFHVDTLEELKKIAIQIVEVSFDVSTKAKSLNKTMEIIGDNYDCVIILDADNIMETDFIYKVNNVLSNGYNAVQGRRVAKNVNTSFAVLDAISEEINNHIFRQGHRALNMSSSLIGSGMAFDYKLFKDIMKTIDSVGEDKELEMKLLESHQKIEYLSDAYVYDEKTQKSDAFYNQRRRWISAQFVYLRRYFFSGVKALFADGHLDYFNKSIQYLVLPRVISLGLLSFCTFLYGVFSFFDFSIISLSFQFWIILFFFNCLALIVAVPKKFYNITTLKALISLPKGVFLMIMAMFNLRGADKKFIHTPHGINDQ